MTGRTSERIWRAARAAYESRGQLKVFMPWGDRSQVSRDIEYDAMVAAFDAATAPALKARLAAHPGCMEPDGAEPCPQYTAAIERVRFLEGRIDAAVVELQRARAERDRWKAAGDECERQFQAKVTELGAAHGRIAELEEALGIDPGEPVRKGWVLGVTREEFDRWKGQEAALKPFAEYAERTEKERPGWKMAPIGIPMAWFIAALKAYRGKPAPPSEEDMKYDNDGYPDLPREPTVAIPRAKFLALTAAAQGHRYESDTVTLPRAQHEALMAAVAALAAVYRISLRRHDAWDRAAEALAALRAAGIEPAEDKT